MAKRLPQGALIGTSIDLGQAQDNITRQMENVIGSLGNLTGLNVSGGMAAAPGVPKDEGAGIDTIALEDQGRLFSEWMGKNKELLTVATIGLIITGVILVKYLR